MLLEGQHATAAAVRIVRATIRYICGFPFEVGGIRRVGAPVRYSMGHLPVNTHVAFEVQLVPPLAPEWQSDPTHSSQSAFATGKSFRGQNETAVAKRTAATRIFTIK